MDMDPQSEDLIEKAEEEKPPSANRVNQNQAILVKVQDHKEKTQIYHGTGQIENVIVDV